MDDALVTMCKGGDTLAVHPTCVAAHAMKGWALAPDASAAVTDTTAQAADKPTRSKARRESAPIEQPDKTA